MTSVVKFPTKYNLEKVEQFAQSYAEELTARPAAERPRTILVVEYYKNDELDATVYDVHIGGMAPEIHVVVGILEMAKYRVIQDTSMMIEK